MSTKPFAWPRAQGLVGLFWLGLAGLVLWGAAGLSEEPDAAIGPAFFPRALAVALLVLVPLYWLENRRALAVALWEGGGRTGGRMAGLLAAGLLAAWLWEPLGGLPTLFLLCFCELKWVEGRGLGRTLLVAGIITLTVWLTFCRMLGVNLPWGVLLLWF